MEDAIVEGSKDVIFIMIAYSSPFFVKANTISPSAASLSSSTRARYFSSARSTISLATVIPLPATIASNCS